MSKQPNHRGKGYRIKTNLSKIQFPEFCPVCSYKAEDLVFITIVERTSVDTYDTKLMMKREEKTSAALEAAKGATTFTVPTCLRHGSKSVRSFRTKFTAVVGFFILFYPVLYFLLQINAALNYSRSLMEPVIGLAVFTTALIIVVLYGVFPRALERGLKFENIDRKNDSVEVVIKNADYRERFLEINELFAVIQEETDTPSRV